MGGHSDEKLEMHGVSRTKRYRVSVAAEYASNGMRRAL